MRDLNTSKRAFVCLQAPVEVQTGRGSRHCSHSWRHSRRDRLSINSKRYHGIGSSILELRVFGKTSRCGGLPLISLMSVIAVRSQASRKLTQ